MIPLILFAATLQSIEYNKVETTDLIPAAIRGAWDASQAACKDEYSTTRMAIGANWISFYESHGLLQIATPAGIPDTDQSVALRFVMGGEGSTWDNEIVLAWSGSQPGQLIWIAAKSEENMNSDRQREQYIRCS